MSCGKKHVGFVECDATPNTAPPDHQRCGIHGLPRIDCTGTTEEIKSNDDASTSQSPGSPFSPQYHSDVDVDGIHHGTSVTPRTPTSSSSMSCTGLNAPYSQCTRPLSTPNYLAVPCHLSPRVGLDPVAMSLWIQHVLALGTHFLMTMPMDLKMPNPHTPQRMPMPIDSVTNNMKTKPMPVHCHDSIYPESSSTSAGIHELHCRCTPWNSPKNGTRPTYPYLADRGANNSTPALLALCWEWFGDTIESAAKRLFSYYKESWAMQLNHRQICVQRVHDAVGGVDCDIIVMNIDLHFKERAKGVIYVVAKTNDASKDGVTTNNKWKVFHFLSAMEMHHRFGITEDRLPKSSRIALKAHLLVKPIGLHEHAVMDMVNGTKLKSLKWKSTKLMRCRRHCKCQEFRAGSVFQDRCQNKKCGHSAAEHGAHGVTEDMVLLTRSITTSQLRQSIVNSLLNDYDEPVPVVVTLCGETWIEWKKWLYPVLDGQEQFVAVSLRWRRSEQRWSIELLDYDGGRIAEQHRLISDFVEEQYWFHHDDFTGSISTKLKIVADSNQWL